MIIESTPYIYFYELIQRAKLHTKIEIDDGCESYVVFLLSDLASGKIKFSEEPLFKLMEYAVNKSDPDNFQAFKLLGDSTLITLSVFPDKISHLSDNYVKKMGQIGYRRCSSIASRFFNGGDVYEQLAYNYEEVASLAKKAKTLAKIHLS